MKPHVPCTDIHMQCPLSEISGISTMSLLSASSRTACIPVAYKTYRNPGLETSNQGYYKASRITTKLAEEAERSAEFAYLPRSPYFPQLLSLEDQHINSIQHNQASAHKHAYSKNILYIYIYIYMYVTKQIFCLRSTF